MNTLRNRLKKVSEQAAGELAVKGFAVATFVVLGWVIADSVRVAHSTAKLDRQPTPAASIALLPPAGHWSFEGMTWSTTSGQFGWTAGDQANPAPHLAELPKGSRRAAARWSSDGQLLMEVVSLPKVIDTDSLIAAWESAGWQVRANSLRQADEFCYLLSREGMLRYAWSASPPEAMDSIMLVDQSTGSFPDHQQ